jgi:hypothetical protein
MPQDESHGPRSYTMSEKARAQRRGAAWKHGGRAQTALRRAIPPCKTGTCPAQFPCSLRAELDSLGKTLEVCPVALTVDPARREAYLKALREGDLSGLEEVTATALAAMSGLHASELEKLMEEGLSVEQDFFGKEGEVIGSTFKVNPRADPLLKISEQLGLTASAQAITPKARGEKKRDEGLGAGGHAAWIHSMRTGFKDGGSE